MYLHLHSLLYNTLSKDNSKFIIIFVKSLLFITVHSLPMYSSEFDKISFHKGYLCEIMSRAEGLALPFGEYRVHRRCVRWYLGCVLCANNEPSGRACTSIWRMSRHRVACYEMQPYVPLRTQLSESGPGRKTILSNLERPPNQACEQ